MQTTKQLREEFAQLHEESGKAIRHAQSEKRNLTTEEIQQNDKRYKRMDDIKAEIEKDKSEARAVFESGIQDLPGYEEIGASFIDGAPTYMGRKKRNYDSIRPLKHSELFSKELRTPQSNIGIGDFVRATVLGPQNERERFALQQSTDSTGGFNLPVDLSTLLIDASRAESVILKAGALTIPLAGSGGKVMRLSDVISPTWRAENAAVTATQTFETATYAQKTLAVIVKASREQLEDSINANSAINGHFASAFAAELDRVCGWGSGSGEPLGIANTSGILEVAANDAFADFSLINQAVYQLATKSVTPTAVVMSPREALSMNNFIDDTGQPLRRPDSLVNIGFYTSANAPVTEGDYGNASTILVGDFSKLWVGVRTEVRIEVLRETYAPNLQYGFLATMRIDTAVLQPKAFCAITGISPA